MLLKKFSNLFFTFIRPIYGIILESIEFDKTIHEADLVSLGNIELFMHFIVAEMDPAVIGVMDE